MTWDFPTPPACSGPEVIAHVDEVGEVIELPVPARWTVEDIATTLAEIASL